MGPLHGQPDQQQQHNGAQATVAAAVQAVPSGHVSGCKPAAAVPAAAAMGHVPRLNPPPLTIHARKWWLWAVAGPGLGLLSISQSRDMLSHCWKLQRTLVGCQEVRVILCGGHWSLERVCWVVTAVCQPLAQLAGKHSVALAAMSCMQWLTANNACSEDSGRGPSDRDAGRQLLAEQLLCLCRV